MGNENSRLFEATYYAGKRRTLSPVATTAHCTNEGYIIECTMLEGKETDGTRSPQKRAEDPLPSALSYFSWLSPLCPGFLLSWFFFFLRIL
jgi:hypothetical protein